MKKVAFITGGHYTPAKAVADELLNTGWDICYVGRVHSFEGDSSLSYDYQELKNHQKIKFLPIITGRLQKQFTRHTIPSLLKIPIGLVQSLYWIISSSPLVIVSFGGYVALPVVIAAWMLQVSIVTHEQTTVFGLANRIIQKLSKRVCVSFKNTMPKDPGSKWVYTGNPIRHDTFTISKNEDISNIEATAKREKQPIVYFTGGKHGSHTINQVVKENLIELLKIACLIVQTGDNREFGDFDAIKNVLFGFSEELRGRALVYKFISGSQVGSVFDVSDIVVGRSGANTVFELAALSKVALLIPIPWSSGGEQSKNAMELINFGGGKIVEQDNLKTEFMPSLQDLISKLDSYKEKAKLAQALIVEDSAQKICKVVEGVI